MLVNPDPGSIHPAGRCWFGAALYSVCNDEDRAFNRPTGQSLSLLIARWRPTVAVAMRVVGALVSA